MVLEGGDFSHERGAIGAHGPPQCERGAPLISIGTPVGPHGRLHAKERRTAEAI